MCSKNLSIICPSNNLISIKQVLWQWTLMLVWTWTLGCSAWDIGLTGSLQVFACDGGAAFEYLLSSGSGWYLGGGGHLVEAGVWSAADHLNFCTLRAQAVRGVRRRCVTPVYLLFRFWAVQRIAAREAAVVVAELFAVITQTALLAVLDKHHSDWRWSQLCCMSIRQSTHWSWHLLIFRVQGASWRSQVALGSAELMAGDQQDIFSRTLKLCQVKSGAGYLPLSRHQVHSWVIVWFQVHRRYKSCLSIVPEG